jgi:hypothetical protein
MQRLCPLSLVAKAGFNFYLAYLYDKQHIRVVDREPYYVCRTFLNRATTGLFDWYCHNYMTFSEEIE